jgi:hypothetical protein
VLFHHGGVGDHLFNAVFGKLSLDQIDQLGRGHRTLKRQKIGELPTPAAEGHGGACPRPCRKSPNTSPPSRGRAHAREATGNQRPWPADKVERWAIDRLIPYAKNARTHSDAQIAAIAASIKRLLTGRGSFADHIHLPELAHAVIVRSPHAGFARK